MKNVNTGCTIAVCLVGLILSYSCDLRAQDEAFISRVYCKGSAMGSTPKGSFSGVSLQTIVKEKWSLTLQHYNGNVRIKNLPADYQPRYGVIIFIPFNDGDPEHQMDISTLTAGRFIRLNRSFWITTEAGISLNKGYEFTFEKRPASNNNLFLINYTESNYNMESTRKTPLGGMLNADIIWAFSSFAGLGFGGYLNANNLQTHAGFQFTLALGWMHRGPRSQ